MDKMKKVKLAATGATTEECAAQIARLGKSLRQPKIITDEELKLRNEKRKKLISEAKADISEKLTTVLKKYVGKSNTEEKRLKMGYDIYKILNDVEPMVKTKACFDKEKRKFVIKTKIAGSEWK